MDREIGPPGGDGEVTGRARILVATRDEALRHQLREGLRPHGHELLDSVSDHHALLREVRSDGACVVLLDAQIGLQSAGALYDRFGIGCVVVGGAAGESTQLARSDLTGVFGYLPRPICPDAVAVAVSIAWSRMEEQKWLSQRICELETKLEQRKLVERAKGLVMQQRELTEPEAMRWLQKQARDARRPLADLAQSILAGGELAYPPKIQ